MYEYQRVILLAVLFSNGSPLILKSTHTNVVPKLTDDVTLSCHYNASENSEVKIDQLLRIRLLKQNDASTWVTFAEISVPNNSNVILPSSLNANVVTSGRIDTLSQSFLLVTWPTADDDIAGSYQCEADGFGEGSRSDVHLSTQTVNVTSFLPVTSELVDIIIKIKHKIHSTVEENFLEVRYWPEGNYTLLSPVSGCPDTPYTKMVGGFAKITTETTHQPNNALSSPSHLHSDVFERCDNRNVFHFRFCRNPIPNDQVVLWPKGSYCIHIYNWPVCPYGFDEGYMDVYLESSSTFGWIEENIYHTMEMNSNFARVFFCCRSDGDPQLPVLLPNHRPFYLYRYQGKCQNVKNMDVTEEWIRLDTDNRDKYTNLMPDGNLNDSTFRLCYYTKKK